MSTPNPDNDSPAPAPETSQSPQSPVGTTTQGGDDTGDASTTSPDSGSARHHHHPHRPSADNDDASVPHIHQGSHIYVIKNAATRESSQEAGSPSQIRDASPEGVAAQVKVEPAENSVSEPPKTGSTVQSTNASINEMVNELVKDTKGAADTVNETANETLNDTTINDTVNETANETVNETVNDTANETINYTVTEGHNETINDTVYETANETANETATETATETASEAAVPQSYHHTPVPEPVYHTPTPQPVDVLPPPPQTTHTSQVVATTTAKSASPELPVVASKPKRKAPITLNTGLVKQMVKEIQPTRTYLGTIIYNPTTTWGTLQMSQLPGLREEDFERLLEMKHNYVEKLKSNYGLVQYIPMIPPLPPAYINYTLTIKIPQRFLELFKVELDANATNRDAWGGAGGIFTDDSNILCVLAHLGLFTGDLDLSEWNENWKGLAPLQTFNHGNKRRRSDGTSETVPEENKAENSKPDEEDTAEMSEILRFPIPGDLAVDVVLLPPMNAYYGYYAHGINTRTWVSKNHHQGLSIAVFNAKWESSGTYLRDKTTFKRYQAEMAQDRRESAELQHSWHLSKKKYNEIRQKYAQVEG